MNWELKTFNEKYKCLNGAKQLFRDPLIRMNLGRFII